MVTNTVTKNTLDQGLCVRDLGDPGLKYSFTNCTFLDTASRPGPLQFPNFTSMRGSTLALTPVGVCPTGKYAWGPKGDDIGAVNFKNVTVTDSMARPWLLSVRTSSMALSGDITVTNKYGCTISGPGTNKLPALKVTCKKHAIVEQRTVPGGLPEGWNKKRFV